MAAKAGAGNRMNSQISVIICTHNPNPVFLKRVLAALRAQTLPKEQWELLLVDNASKEPLASLWDLSWHPHGRHLREEKLGKTNALLTSISEAKGELLVIVDDDNVLEPDYLETVLKLEQHHPHLGVWGGSCLPEFETQPPKFLENHLNRLAISTVLRPRWTNAYLDFEAIPPGAGMIVRREVMARYKEVVTGCSVRKRLDRTGKSPGAAIPGCGDTDIAWTAIDLGFSSGRFPDLMLTHIIPRQRVDPNYILALIEGDATSRVLLDYARKQKTFSTNTRTSPLRQLWLRLRLPDFDYRAQKATTIGIQKGVSFLETLNGDNN
jgi:glycosyltransferase involved in cell wall biosynthesis